MLIAIARLVTTMTKAARTLASRTPFKATMLAKISVMPTTKPVAAATLKTTIVELIEAATTKATAVGIFPEQRSKTETKAQSEARRCAFHDRTFVGWHDNANFGRAIGIESHLIRRIAVTKVNANLRFGFW